MGAVKIAYLPKLNLVVVENASSRVAEEMSPAFRLCVVEPSGGPPLSVPEARGDGLSWVMA